MSMNEPDLQSLAEKVGPTLTEFFDSKSDAYYCALVFMDKSGHVRSFLVTEETPSSPILVPRTKTKKGGHNAGRTLYGLDIPAIGEGTRFLRKRVGELEGALRDIERDLELMRTFASAQPRKAAQRMLEVLRAALSQANAQAKLENQEEEGEGK